MYKPKGGESQHGCWRTCSREQKSCACNEAETTMSLVHDHRSIRVGESFKIRSLHLFAL
jgi:hypothetical protein